ncbi:MAG: anti-sigma regulatory factor [Clostridia bacterium]|nr:anti-sigma regulatory factor [Clostridia bacterium]
MTERGSATFEEIHSVEKGNFATAGQGAAAFKNMLKKLGVNSSVVRRVAIASYEAEINLAIHSDGGKLVLSVYPGKIRLVSEDIGPGIADIELAMQEGYSTATEEVRMLGFGAGMGMPNMKRCSDSFDLKSALGKGTTITMEFNL